MDDALPSMVEVGRSERHLMTPREVELKLKRIYWMKREVKAKEMQLAELQTQATHITAVFSPVKASGSNSSKVENYAVRSYEISMDIEESIGALYETLHEGMKMIESLDDPLLRCILIDYHINGIPLAKLEKKYFYSRSQIYVLRQKAYEQIADKTQ